MDHLEPRGLRGAGGLPRPQDGDHGHGQRTRRADRRPQGADALHLPGRPPDAPRRHRGRQLRRRCLQGQGLDPLVQRLPRLRLWPGLHRGVLRRGEGVGARVR
jgi:hypothetical protein